MMLHMSAVSCLIALPHYWHLLHNRPTSALYYLEAHLQGSHLLALAFACIAAHVAGPSCQ